IELGEFEEASQGAQATGAGLVEDEVQGQDEAADEVLAGGALAEGDEVGVEVGVAVLAEPVLQGGAWDAGLLRELPLGVGRVEGVVEGMACVGRVESVPAEGVWRGGGGGRKLWGSHGSFP